MHAVHSCCLACTSEASGCWCARGAFGLSLGPGLSTFGTRRLVCSRVYLGCVTLLAICQAQPVTEEEQRSQDMKCHQYHSNGLMTHYEYAPMNENLLLLTSTPALIHMSSTSTHTSKLK